MGDFVDQTVAKVREQVGDANVICGLSGGVDSSVTAALLHKAIGDQLKCIFVDNGLLRKGERQLVEKTFGDHFKIDLRTADATDQFLTPLQGVTDPQEKRKIIGREFIEAFKREAATIPDAKFLAQGTLYPDVIESGHGHSGHAANIKLHHNVGGLPAELGFDLVEPLRELFKDEVRAAGEVLGLPERLVWRHPFPGPGLAVRVIGDITPERLTVLREADEIVLDELVSADLYRKTAQVFRGAAARRHGRRDGGRPQLRSRHRRPGRRKSRLHDRRLGPAAVRGVGSNEHAHHQRSSRRRPRRVRHQLQAACDDRVGVDHPPTLDSLPPEQQQKLSRYLDLLIEANTQFNLTRIVDREDAEVFHLGDALALLPHLPTAGAGRFDLCDVGSGGGVPGIILAVVRPHARVTLVESTGKKADFLQAVVDDLELENAEVFNGRAERMPRHGQYDIVVTRAAGPMAKLLPWCRPLVRRGGYLLAMKGPKLRDELHEATPFIREQRATLSTHPYELGGQTGARHCEGSLVAVAVRRRQQRPSRPVIRSEAEPSRRTPPANTLFGRGPAALKTRSG